MSGSVRGAPGNRRPYREQAFTAWLAEWGRELRRRQTGLLLLTAHRAKGLEFDHVVILDGGWGQDETGYRDRRTDEVLRLYYVAMTRARHTLTLLRMSATSELELRDAPWPAQQRGGDYWFPEDIPALVHREYVVRTEPPSQLDTRYKPLELSDVDLGFAGQHASKHPVHGAIGALRTGDPLEVRENGGGWLLADASGQVVGQLARNYRPPSDRCRVSAQSSVGIGLTATQANRTAPCGSLGKSWCLS